MTRAVSARTLDEAVRFLRDDPELRPVAGCTDLMVCEPEARADLPAVLDLLSIPELSGISEAENGALDIGATTSFTRIRRSQLIGDRYPALAEAAGLIGGWQIQNRATLGGNIANASPAGDSLPVLLALRAEIVAVGANGRRLIPYRDFHTDYRRTALEPGELIAAIRLPEPPPLSSQLFRKVGTREAQAISKVVVALLAVVEEGVFTTFRLAAGSVAATPVRLTRAEETAAGQPVGLSTAEAIGRAAAASVEPIDDVRSTAGYRRFALERVVRRMALQLSE